MKENSKNIVIVILILLLTATCIYLVVTIIKSKETIDDYEQIVSFEKDSLRTIIDEQGNRLSILPTLELKNSQLLEGIRSKDKTIDDLYRLIEEKESTNNDLRSALIIKTKAIADYKDSIQNKIVGQTIVNDTIYQTYSRDFSIGDSTSWIYGTTLLGRDRFEIDVYVIDEVEISISKRRNNIFKKWEIITEYESKNPYVFVQDARVYYENIDKTKRFVFGPQVGVSVGPTYSFTGDHGSSLSAYIGFGLTYKLFEF